MNTSRGAVAQQQDGGRGTRCYGVDGHELPLLASSLILKERPLGRVSKDEGICGSWFETRQEALLTMRIFLNSRAGLRLQVRSLSDPFDPRQQIIDLVL